MRQLIRPLPSKGFTLIELMVAVAVLAVILALGAPDLSTFLANNKLRGSADTLSAALAAARVEALKRNCTVEMKVVGALALVEASSACAKAEVIKEMELPADLQVSGASSTRFGSTGMVVPFGETSTFQLGLVGKSCGTGVQCPSVRAESGGAISVCKSGSCS